MGWSKNTGFEQFETKLPKLNYGSSKINHSKDSGYYFRNYGRGGKWWDHDQYPGVTKADSGGPVVQESKNGLCLVGVNVGAGFHNYIFYVRKTPFEHIHIDVTNPEMNKWVYDEMDKSESYRRKQP